MSQADDAGIRALFEAYAAGFEAADADAVTALFAWPATIWQFGKGHIFSDGDELGENVDALIDVFDEAGIITTTSEVRALRIAGAAAFADVLWRQADEKGEVLHAFACQYLLLRQEGGWRIATAVNEVEVELPAEDGVGSL
jgi:ketosteroid isomerase-like protein